MKTMNTTGSLDDPVATGGQILVSKRSSSKADPRFAKRFLNLDDFQRAAKRHLPRQIYGYYAGAAETEQSFTANRASFEDLAFIPRVLANVAKRTTTKSLFGTEYKLPLGIAPMGLSGLATFEGDLVLARAAEAERIPMIVSATSIIPLERLAGEGAAQWFQAYLPGDAERIDAMVNRVACAGFHTFVLTADVPVPANRENNIRTGFSIPLRPSPRLVVDGLLHPTWSVGTFLRTVWHGQPRFENMDAFRGPPLLSRDLERQIGARDQLDWRHAARIRDRWKGRLVIKGLLSPADAARAREIGADGIIVSNHGGRQLDGAIAPMRVLPDIVKEAGSMAVMLDGGVRRGSDVLKALAAGADFVFIGRPFLMAAVFGQRGVRHAVSLMADEIGRNMALLGIKQLSELDPSFLRKAT